MAIVTISADGVSGGVPGPGPTPEARRARRACDGWSPSSARANERFLRSVEASSLEGVIGVAVTLTLGREGPGGGRLEGPWFKGRKALLLQFLKDRPQVLAYHWVVEFHRSGAPHVHLFLAVSDGAVVGDLLSYWLRCAAAETRAFSQGQHVAPVSSAMGWKRYVARHGARSAGHGQRDGGFQGGGRMWGRGGRWFLRSEKLVVEGPAYWRFRRVLRRYLVSVAGRDRAVAEREADRRAQVLAERAARVAALRAMGRRSEARAVNVGSGALKAGLKVAARRAGKLRLHEWRARLMFRGTRWQSETRGFSVWADGSVVWRILAWARESVLDADGVGPVVWAGQVLDEDTVSGSMLAAVVRRQASGAGLCAS